MRLQNVVILGIMVVLTINGIHCDEERRLLLHSADDLAMEFHNLRKEIETLKDSQSKDVAMLKANQSQEIAMLKSNQTQELENMKANQSKEMDMLKSEIVMLKSNQTQEVTTLKSEIVMLKSNQTQEVTVLKSEIVLLKSNQTQEIESLKSMQSQETAMLKSEIVMLKSNQTQDITSLQTRLAERGTTYIRWGRTTCAGNNTQKVYSGYTAGSPYDIAGGAASFVCLPEHPTWAKYTDGIQNLGGYISGTEYEDYISSFLPFPRQMRNEDAPCVLCHTPRSVSIMIPGRTDCYQDWTLEYTGYLMTGHTTHKAATDYACVDAKPEAVLHGEANQEGKLQFFTEVKCGSLPCQEYPDGRELACVVCSK